MLFEALNFGVSLVVFFIRLLVQYIDGPFCGLSGRKRPGQIRLAPKKKLPSWWTFLIRPNFTREERFTLPDSHASAKWFRPKYYILL